MFEQRPTSDEIGKIASGTITVKHNRIGNNKRTADEENRTFVRPFVVLKRFL